MAATLPASKSKGPRTIYLAAAVGSAVEYYDYYAYVTASALVFPTVFFPHLSSEAGRLASFATLGATFVARPVGAIVFGHWGDRIGRKQLLFLALILMGISTVAVGLIPGAQQWGVAAPLLLLILRCVQGFAVGGEFGGAVVLASESAPPGRRGLMSSAGTVGSVVGLFFSTLSFYLVDLLGAGQSSTFLSWGWRVPFIASGVLVLIGVYVRGKIPESPEFLAAQKNSTLSSSPLRELLRNHSAVLFLLTGSIVATYMLFYIKDAFLVSIARTELGLSFHYILGVNLISAVIMLASILIHAYISDKVPRKRIYLLGVTLITVWVAVATAILVSSVPAAFPLTMWISAAILGMVNGSLGAYMVDDFPVHLRYSGFAFAFNVAGIVGGIIPPFIATRLYGDQGVVAVGLTLAIISLGSLACGLGTRRYFRSEIP